MPAVMPRVRHRELGLLTLVAVTVLALGLFVARDFRQSAEDTRQLYGRLSDGLDLIDNLQFNTQEVRRILLYALHTSDANLQVEYADQSREADAQVKKLLDGAATVITAPRTRALLDAVTREWAKYLVVRDEVIGLILEGSLPEGVALDQHEGAGGFNDVRRGIHNLKDSFESEAAIQVDDARARATRATWRLILLVASALFAAAVGVGLVNRRAVLEGLLRSEAHKGSILQAVPDPIISTDTDGRIIELNEAAERAFGFNRADAVGARLEEMILPATMRSVLAEVLSLTQAESKPPRIQTVGARRDGTEFPMEVAAAAHTVGRDRIWTLHISDMTARRLAEAHLREASEAAVVADRAKSEFLATMSHELRTPLNAVIGVADMLQRSHLAAPQRELVRLLRSNATALLGLVGDVLDHTRIEAGLMDLAPALFPLQTCIEDALDAVTESAASKGLEIGYRIDPEVPVGVVADQDRVRQVLLNLLSNAVKFTEAGEVSVHASAEAGPDRGVSIAVKVRDTGIGIPVHLQDRLFHRFSQIDSSATRQHRGAGLGLAIAEHLSRLLGGSLSVQSEAGRGSTFTFVFAAQLPPGPPPPDPLAGTLAGVRVLAFLGPGIVGDQVRALLRRWGADARVIADDADPQPVLDEVSLNAVLVDAQALDGRLQALALKVRPQWRRQRLQLIWVTRAFLGSTPPGGATDRIVPKPVRSRVLHEALCGAAGRPVALAARPPIRAVGEAPVRDALAILLAEDDDANRRVVQLMLEELGLKADVVTSGAEAVARARARPYDVILMDLQMPDMDGLEATRRIRAEQRGTPPRIVALTANVIRGEEDRCRAAGMDGYMTKPLRLATLAAVLRPQDSTPS